MIVSKTLNISQYHIYGVSIKDGVVGIYIDGVKKLESVLYNYPGGGLSQKQYFDDLSWRAIFGIRYSGTNVELLKSVLPQKMNIDYVRIFVSNDSAIAGPIHGKKMRLIQG